MACIAIAHRLLQVVPVKLDEANLAAGPLRMILNVKSSCRKKPKVRYSYAALFIPVSWNPAFLLNRHAPLIDAGGDFMMLMFYN